MTRARDRSARTRVRTLGRALARAIGTVAVASLVLSAGTLAGAAPTAKPTPTPTPVTVNGRIYDAYVEAATKPGQFAYYTCEFDAAWVVLKTFGDDVPLADQLAIVGLDQTVEPYAVPTTDGFVIYGGDISTDFSGDYTQNFLARTTGAAMRPLFEEYGLDVRPVRSRRGVETTLREGGLVWMKSTVDFQPWEPATWVAPNGRTFPTVLGNDHAVVAIGYNDDGVVIRDVLGPTDTNWARTQEYEVDWKTFLAVAKAQGFDALAVSRP
ncbi:MAG: C39 family peptidase, partial [Actinomycetota bacterium]|nr:C39 family peptidase [Actinomycetota bacterium]